PVDPKRPLPYRRIRDVQRKEPPRSESPPPGPGDQSRLRHYTIRPTRREAPGEILDLDRPAPTVTGGYEPLLRVLDPKTGEVVTRRATHREEMDWQGFPDD